MTARSSRVFASVLIFASLLFSSQLAPAEFKQQGPKLVGAGAVGLARQGWSVALSGDGNTAIVGGNEDNSATGAAWVYTRIGGVWTQQGSKLVGTGAVGNARQGISVALSGDGNTAIVGGPDDNPNTNDNLGAGAAWVFTRSGGVWTQQGGKLVGTSAVGSALQGNSVALSGDGNTAIVGGPGDNSNAGAAWVYTRIGGVWTQQGSKLVGTGAVGGAQGWSVALSGDGNTATVGGPGDNSNAGAAWVYTRSGGIWTQQGSKLVGTGAVGAAFQGASVALSGDSNTAIVGGYGDNSGAGAAWVYTRSGGVWTQQGSKLVGTGAVGAAFQGASVALSGNTAIVGGPGDNSNAGAAWVYTRSGGVWSQQGSKLVGAVGAALRSYSVALSTDGNTAIVGGYGDNSNTGAAWVFVQPTVPSSQVAVAPPPPPPGPTVMITSPAKGATYRGYFNADIAVSAADPTGIASITIEADSKILKTCTKTTSCSDIWRYRSPPGTHTITATAIDNAGIQGSASIVITDVNLFAQLYTVRVSASPSADGTVSGGGTFAAGSSETVTATANNGYSFGNWPG